MNATLIKAVLAALGLLRTEATDFDAAYYARLVNMASVFRKACSPVGKLDRFGLSWHGASYRYRTDRFVKAVGTALRFLSAIPSYAYQIKIVSKRVGSGTTSSSLVFALGSNRISLEPRLMSVRDDLLFLTRTFGRKADMSLEELIAKAECLVLADALFVSGLWKQRKKCWAENVLIVDGGFLLIFSLWMLWTRLTKRIAWSSVGSHPCRLYKTDIDATDKATVRPLYACFCASYLVLVEMLRAEAAIFLTCNSTLTELLRACMIQTDRCRKIYEVMHGVGSLPVERYFAAVLQAGRKCGSYEKHFFIPQVPNLPIYGVFRQQLASDGVAMNPYMMQFLRECHVRGESFEQFVDREYAAIVGDARGTRPPLVITIFGNYPVDGRLYDSPSFVTECLLIRLIDDFLRKSAGKESTILIYVPHPTFSISDFDAKMFGNDKVRLYPDSVLCWLISDMCVGLMSSALFEAAFFGVRAFTPMVESDGFYPAEYLGLLDHPQSGSGEELAAELWATLERAFDSPRIDVVQKASERFSRCLGFPSSTRP